MRTIRGYRRKLYLAVDRLPVGGLLLWEVNNNMDAYAARSGIAREFPDQVWTHFRHRKLWIVRHSTPRQESVSDGDTCAESSGA